MAELPALTFPSRSARNPKVSGAENKYRPGKELADKLVSSRPYFLANSRQVVAESGFPSHNQGEGMEDFNDSGLRTGEKKSPVKCSCDVKTGRLYWGPGPVPGEIVGTVTRKNGETGALVRLHSGRLVQGNAGAFFLPEALSVFPYPSR